MLVCLHPQDERQELRFPSSEQPRATRSPDNEALISLLWLHTPFRRQGLSSTAGWWTPPPRSCHTQAGLLDSGAS